MEPSESSLQFIGTATLLIRYAGFHILVDPNFVRRGETIHIGYMMHTTRLLDPAIGIHELPPLDFGIVSHLHEDHFDKLAARRLDKNLLLVSTGQGCGILRRQGFRETHSLRTWESLQVRKEGVTVQVSAMPARHTHRPFSALMPSVMGTLLVFQAPGRPPCRIYISGDTLWTRGMRRIPARAPNLDVAVLHLGATRVAGLPVTMDARDGVALARLLGARAVVPVHYGDYPVMREPVEKFVSAMHAAGLGARLAVLPRGGWLSLAPAPGMRDAA